MTAFWRAGRPEHSGARTVAEQHSAAATGWDEYLMYLSMALLLISTIQETGPIGDAVKVVWLVSVAMLSAFNVGAAFGVYVAAAALFAVLSFDGWGSLVERPDNYALLLVAGALGLRIVARRPARLWDASTLWIGGLVAFGLAQMAWIGLLTRVTFAGYMRIFGLPMLMFLLIAQCGLSLREFRALTRSLLVLGAYMAMVSIAERAGWYDLIVPAWITTPTPAFLDASKNFSVLTGRSGGLLMQSEYNGLALSLIYCIAILSGDWSSRSNRWAMATVGILCLVGIFFTYTRAAWLACVPASFILLWGPSATRAKTYLKRLGLLGASAAVIITLEAMPSSFARQRIREPDAVLVRLNIWRASLSMVADRPLLGSGFSTFSGNLEDYRHEMTVGPPRNIQGTVAHNIVLSVLAEMGVIGLVLYAGALLAVLRRAMTGARRLWGQKGAVWVTVFFGVYFLQMQFMFLGDTSTHQIYFGTMGAIAGLLAQEPSWGSKDLGYQSRS